MKSTKQQYICTYLFVKTPYVSSINAIERFNIKKKKRFRELASANIILQKKSGGHYNAKNRPRPAPYWPHSQESTMLISKKHRHNNLFDTGKINEI